MRPDRFRPLLAAKGPFASIYFEDSHDSADAEAQMELRWREIRDQLDEHVPPQTVAAIERSLETAHPAVGRSGRLLIADAESVVLDEHLLRGRPTPEVRISEYPYIVPAVEHGVEHPTYVVVAVDHAGADITLHLDGHSETEAADGGGYPVHKASSAETAGYGDPQRRVEEAGRKNFRAAAERVATLVDNTDAQLVFVVGEVRSRSDFVSAAPDRIAGQIVELNVGARTSLDEAALNNQVATTLEMRRIRTIDDAAARFQAGIRGDRKLATEGLAGVCAALRSGAVDTLIIGDVGDAAVVVAADDPSAVAPTAEVLSEWGKAPTGVARADEVLPLVATAINASLIRTDERITPKEGIAATLRYPLPSSSSG